MKQRGFTLVEVLIAFLILTLVVTTSLGIFYDREKRLRAAEETVMAYQLLANEIEVRRQMNYEELVPDQQGVFLSDTALLTRLSTGQTEVMVEQISPYVKSVTMVVRWGEGPKVAQLSILRSDTGGSGLW